jgi:hypothetical protein
MLLINVTPGVCTKPGTLSSTVLGLGSQISETLYMYSQCVNRTELTCSLERVSDWLSGLTVHHATHVQRNLCVRHSTGLEKTQLVIEVIRIRLCISHTANTSAALQHYCNSSLLLQYYSRLSLQYYSRLSLQYYSILSLQYFYSTTVVSHYSTSTVLQ